jgi:hypothetical protein
MWVHWESIPFQGVPLARYNNGSIAQPFIDYNQIRCTGAHGVRHYPKAALESMPVERGRWQLCADCEPWDVAMCKDCHYVRSVRGLCSRGQHSTSFFQHFVFSFFWWCTLLLFFGSFLPNGSTINPSCTLPLCSRNVQNIELKRRRLYLSGKKLWAALGPNTFVSFCALGEFDFGQDNVFAACLVFVCLRMRIAPRVTRRKSSTGDEQIGRLRVLLGCYSGRHTSVSKATKDGRAPAAALVVSCSRDIMVGQAPFAENCP